MMMRNNEERRMRMAASVGNAPRAKRHPKQKPFDVWFFGLWQAKLANVTT
jgi:hypothetical protein